MQPFSAPGTYWDRDTAGPTHCCPFTSCLSYYRSPAPGAQRLGLVTLQQTVLALVQAVETPVQGTHIMDVPEIRQVQLNLAAEPTRRSA